MKTILHACAALVAPVPSEEALDSIASYRYKPNALTTPVTTTLDRLSDFVVSYLPVWIAPNLITVCGAIPMCIVACCVASLCPTSLMGSAPPWLLIAAALVLVWQLFLDECDGRQARRLGVGSSLGRLMDHGTDAIMATFMLWFAQLLTEYPTKFIIVGQAASSIVGLVMPWVERYKGTFPIYMASELILLLVLFLFAAGIWSPMHVHKLLVSSPVDDAYNMNLRSLWGVVPGVVIAYNIVSTLKKAKEMGKLRAAILELTQPVLVVPSTLMWRDQVLDTNARHISTVIGCLVAMYFLQSIIKTMASPHYNDSVLIDKPCLVVYILFASCSRLLSAEWLATILPCYSALSVVVCSAWYFAIFIDVKSHLHIAHMFRVPAVKQQEFLDRQQEILDSACLASPLTV